MQATQVPGQAQEERSDNAIIAVVVGSYVTASVCVSAATDATASAALTAAIATNSAIAVSAYATVVSVGTFITATGAAIVAASPPALIVGAGVGLVAGIGGVANAINSSNRNHQETMQPLNADTSAFQTQTQALPVQIATATARETNLQQEVNQLRVRTNEILPAYNLEQSRSNQLDQRFWQLIDIRKELITELTLARVPLGPG